MNTHRMKNVHSVQHSSKIWNEVKFDHLQRHCDEPIDVPVNDLEFTHVKVLHCGDQRNQCIDGHSLTLKDWGGVERDPELTHAKVMHCGDQSNQCSECTDVQGCLPVDGHSLSLHQREARGRHHRDRNDSKGNRNAIRLNNKLELGVSSTKATKYCIQLMASFIFFMANTRTTLEAILFN